MHSELAEWWPLLSDPADCAEEAELFRALLKESVDPPPRTLLELGSGGGNNASHLKAHFEVTLVDRSPHMLAVSRRLNPECEHVQGDLRTVRLGRQFGAVLVHDAISYLTTEDDLAAALATAFAHCRSGGVALFVPDHVRETYRPKTSHGGHDGDRRAMRYLQWSYDPDPEDTTLVTDFAFLLREADGTVRVMQDRHVTGLFPRATWIRLLQGAGFTPHIVPDRTGRELFLASRP